MVSPIQAEQRGQAGDHPAWGAESWQAELVHEEGAAHGGTTVLQEQRGDAQSSIPGSTSRQTLCPPKRTRTGGCPSAGRAGMRMILLVMCSPAPCLWCCHWEGRSRAGRELLHTLRKSSQARQSWAGCDQNLLWLLHSESWEPFGGPHLVPGRTGMEQQAGRGEGAAHASDMCCVWLCQTAGSGSLHVWKQHFCVSHFTKPQTITVCRCTGA